MKVRVDDLADRLLGETLDLLVEGASRRRLRMESTTTTPSLVRITVALQLTLYLGAAMAA
jgi:hypothetical protein